MTIKEAKNIIYDCVYNGEYRPSREQEEAYLVIMRTLSNHYTPIITDAQKQAIKNEVIAKAEVWLRNRSHRLELIDEMDITKFRDDMENNNN